MKEIFGRYSSNHKLADLHLHTDMTDGTLTPDQTVRLAEHREIDAIAITDHNTIKPAEVAWDIKEKARLKIDVVIGSEIKTRDGHVIGLFLTKDIPKEQSTERTLYEIHKQNGIAIAPHPTYTRVPSLREEVVKRIVESKDPEVYLDGFEIFNGGIYLFSLQRTRNNKQPSHANENAMELYKKYNGLVGAAIGGSDNHRLTVGYTLTGFKGNIREAIEKKETIVLALEGHELMENYEASIDFFGEDILQKKRARHVF